MSRKQLTRRQMERQQSLALAPEPQQVEWIEGELKIEDLVRMAADEWIVKDWGRRDGAEYEALPEDHHGPEDDRPKVVRETRWAPEVCRRRYLADALTVAIVGARITKRSQWFTAVVDGDELPVFWIKMDEDCPAKFALIAWHPGSED